MSALRLLAPEVDEFGAAEVEIERPARLRDVLASRTEAAWWPVPAIGQPYLRVRQGIAADILTVWTDETADLTRWAESLPGGRIDVYGIAEPFGRLTPAEAAALASGSPLARRESLIGVVDHGAVHLSRVVLPDEVSISVLGVEVMATRDGDGLVLDGQQSIRALVAAVESLERIAPTNPRAAAVLARVRG